MRPNFVRQEVHAEGEKRLKRHRMKLESGTTESREDLHPLTCDLMYSDRDRREAALTERNQLTNEHNT
jgi:hypothetical protein